MIELSNNEAATLIKLAARGVRYPWGLGEEAAHVSRWLIERQLPSLDLFRALFAWTDKRNFDDLILQQHVVPWQCTSDALCPLVCGTAIIDSPSVLISVDKIDLVEVVCPMLLLPFIMEASIALDRSICVSWSETKVIVNGAVIELFSGSEDVLCSRSFMEKTASVSIAVVANPSANPAPSSDENTAVLDDINKELWPKTTINRVLIDLSCVESLKQYAHRTYAPATEQSRLSGAGAGTTDND